MKKVYSIKIELPHEAYYLDMNLTQDLKLEEVAILLQEKLVFDGEEMTVEEYFSETWDNPVTKKNLDMIGYYLIRGDDEGILSNDDIKEMERKPKNYVTFSDLSKKRQVEIGLIDAG